MSTALEPDRIGAPDPPPAQPSVLALAVITLAVVPAAVASWPIPAVLAVVPTLAATLMVVYAPGSDRAAAVLLASTAAVVAAVPGALGVGDLVEPDLDVWWWRISLLGPPVVAAVALDRPRIVGACGAPDHLVVRAGRLGASHVAVVGFAGLVGTRCARHDHAGHRGVVDRGPALTAASHLGGRRGCRRVLCSLRHRRTPRRRHSVGVRHHRRHQSRISSPQRLRRENPFSSPRSAAWRRSVWWPRHP